MFSIQMALMLLVGVLTIIFIISFIVLIIALIQQKRNRRRHAAKRKKSLNRRKKMKDISSENQEGIFEIKEDAGIRLLKDPRADKKYRQQIKLAFRSNFICRGRKKRFPGHYAVSSR